MNFEEMIQEIAQTNSITFEQFRSILEHTDKEDIELLFAKARQVREEEYGKTVYTRGLIEFTNYCRNDCYYCGIRKSNANADRYRLDEETILACAKEGYELGYRTFVLQGGEDGYYTKERIGQIVRSIKEAIPDCAITLSIGEHSYDEYKYWYDCGADRYLLRHEAASERLYKSLHPERMKLSERKQCLKWLKEIGYQTGAGFMVGAPGQTIEDLWEDIVFLQELQPHMIGIGPFIPQSDTPYAQCESGTVEQTVRLLAILRLLMPKVLLPATTALGTLSPFGREKGLKAGANVVMPNLSPVAVRDKYALYDNKICTGDEAAQCRGCIGRRVASCGYEITEDVGDSRVWYPSQGETR
jgi:biotin synthase